MEHVKDLYMRFLLMLPSFCGISSVWEYTWQRHEPEGSFFAVGIQSSPFWGIKITASELSFSCVTAPKMIQYFWLSCSISGGVIVKSPNRIVQCLDRE